jgi:heme exporter protein A
VLEFTDVTLRRGGRLLFEALSFTLRSGGGVHVTGPNGAGKSSLIRLAAGLLDAQFGTVSRAPLALSDEAVALDRELPLHRALAFWSGLSSSARLNSALDALALGHLADVPVRLLSTGQMKRASFARVAASAAPLWLLDEPLNGLDAQSVERVSALLSAHRSSGGAILAASHVPLVGDWVRLELGA